MPLPINIKDTIEGRTIESSRIEYKRGWNPESILHSICAFANDIEYTGGGYIFIGIEEKDSRPSEVVGLTEEEVSTIENRLFKLCNLIEPRYVPRVSEEFYKDKRIFVIWAVTDRNRPFKCPVKVFDDSKIEKQSGIEKAYYIRRMSHTVRTNRDEEQELIRMCRRSSFDNEVNNSSSVESISTDKVKEYLSRIKSSINVNRQPFTEILQDMHLVEGCEEFVKPLNVALMMFSNDPTEHFPGARIEIVYKPRADGTDMEESVISGPVPYQIEETLRQLRSRVIRERIVKIPGQAEANRFYNYPYEALEETITNAVYHRDYQDPRPTIIEVYPNEIQIISIPGPDPSITDKDLRELDIHSRWCRNPRLGDFLKELKLTEGRNTGIPLTIGAMRRNGSPMPVFITDVTRDYLEVHIPIHPGFVEQEDIGERVGANRRDSESIRNDIWEALRINGCMTTKEIAKELGYSKITSLLRRTINEMISEGILEYRYPDNPRHPNQKICVPRLHP